MAHIAQTLSKHYAYVKGLTDWHMETLPEKHLSCYCPWLLNHWVPRLPSPSINGRTVSILTVQQTEKNIEQNEHVLSVSPIRDHWHTCTHTHIHTCKEGRNTESFPLSVWRCPTTPLIWLPGRGSDSCLLSSLLGFTNNVSLSVKITKSGTTFDIPLAYLPIQISSFSSCLSDIWSTCCS